MDHLTKDLNCIAYLDDIIVYGKTPEELIHNLDQILKRCVNVNLKLHPKKCVFGTAYTEFLGYMLSPGR